MALRDDVVRQIDTVLRRHQDMRSRSKWDDLSDLPPQNVTALVTLMCDTIGRFAPPNSQYLEGMRAILKRSDITHANNVPHIAGILLALKIAYEADYLATVSGLLHADMFSSFIDMATYLLSEGYKDPSAVIIGSVLEEHIRQLCIKSSIPVEAAGRPKKAEQMNTDLTTHTIYSKLDQKSVTSWLDLRNKAAHGKYGEYSKEQVALLIQSIQDFIIRNPA